MECHNADVDDKKKKNNERVYIIPCLSRISASSILAAKSGTRDQKISRVHETSRSVECHFSRQPITFITSYFDGGRGRGRGKSPLLKRPNKLKPKFMVLFAFIYFFSPVRPGSNARAHHRLWIFKHEINMHRGASSLFFFFLRAGIKSDR